MNGRVKQLVVVEMAQAKTHTSMFVFFRTLCNTSYKLDAVFDTLCISCRNNPVYQLSLDEGSDDNDVLIELKGPKQYSVGFEVIQISSPRNRAFERHDSGAFRCDFCYVEIKLFSKNVSVML